ncbi:hypothetical protein [Rhizorhabdus sp.]|uniref:hypothetical protein n=1 Tax=Rhizorhabdus sp. TaxID=1968843 RepID=UPI001B752425|nr:hypothetical protein [Rhizorhabdus sp.]MBP8234863.1 hypothetical protein [Rhizorhabdus sp.]
MAGKKFRLAARPFRATNEAIARCIPDIAEQGAENKMTSANPAIGAAEARTIRNPA